MDGFDGSPGLVSLEGDNGDMEGEEGEEGEGEQALNTDEGALAGAMATGVGRGRGRSGGRREMGGKGGRALRGYNWTEQENLILIEQKRREHGERHRRGAASEKLVHGKEAWRMVTEGCNAQVGFRERDQNQVCNKWDALGKEFKRIRDYLASCDAVDWWRLSKVDRKELARTRKLPLEFTEAMYKALDPWHGQRMMMVMGGNMGSIVDTERDASSLPVQDGCGRARRAGKGAGSDVAVAGCLAPTSRTQRARERALSSAATATPPTTSCGPSEGGARALGRGGMSSCPGTAVPGSSAATADPPTTPSSAPSEGRTRSPYAPGLSTEPNTPEEGTPSSAGRKRKVGGAENFERDFYCDYLAPGEAQEADERVWRSSIHEARLASKDAQAATMEERLYQLEVKRSARMERMYELEMQKQVNIGNMTNALLKMANSIENMTRVLLDKSR